MLFSTEKWQSLTRAELGPGTSPLVSGVSDSLRFKSSENSWVTGVGGCCGVKVEDGPGRDWAMLSLGSSSVMSSQDYRNNTETQPWDKCAWKKLFSWESCGSIRVCSVYLYVPSLSHCPALWAPGAHSPSLHWCGVLNGKRGVLPDGFAAADCHSQFQKSHPWRKWVSRLLSQSTV